MALLKSKFNESFLKKEIAFYLIGHEKIPQDLSSNPSGKTNNGDEDKAVFLLCGLWQTWKAWKPENASSLGL